MIFITNLGGYNMAKRFLDIEKNEVILHENEGFELSTVEDLLTGDFLEYKITIGDQFEYLVDKQVYDALLVLKNNEPPF